MLFVLTFQWFRKLSRTGWYSRLGTNTGYFELLKQLKSSTLSDINNSFNQGREQPVSGHAVQRVLHSEGYFWRVIRCRHAQRQWSDFVAQLLAWCCRWLICRRITSFRWLVTITVHVTISSWLTTVLRAQLTLCVNCWRLLRTVVNVLLYVSHQLRFYCHESVTGVFAYTQCLNRKCANFSCALSLYNMNRF